MKGATDADRAGKDMSFAAALAAWDGKRKVTFRMGTTSEPLRSIGIADKNIVWHGGKIAEIMRKHPGMTREIISQVPEILNMPIIVLKSHNSESRVVLFGAVYDAHGAPVTAILELQPTDKGGQLLNMNVVVSAYGKDSSPVQFIEQSELLYLDPDKNRTEKWMQSVGLQLPSDATIFGSIGTITYPDGKVKIDGVPYQQYMQQEGRSSPHTRLPIAERIDGAKREAQARQEARQQGQKEQIIDEPKEGSSVKEAYQIDKRELLKNFNAQYKFLYDGGQHREPVRHAAKRFDDKMISTPEFQVFVSELVRLRGDAFSSDREAAALMFALDEVPPRYQVCTWSRDIGSDEKLDYHFLSDAMKEAENFRGQEEYAAVYDRYAETAYVAFGDLTAPVFTDKVKVMPMEAWQNVGYKELPPGAVQLAWLVTDDPLGGGCRRSFFSLDDAIAWAQANVPAESAGWGIYGGRNDKGFPAVLYDVKKDDSGRLAVQYDARQDGPDPGKTDVTEIINAAKRESQARQAARGQSGHPERPQPQREPQREDAEHGR